MTWWNTDWQYKREITIQENSGNNLTDYQVKIVLNSSNFDFSKANSDGSDIRFVDSDDTTPLSYWIEKWDSVNQEAIVWVKVPSIPANSTKTIYMYYGNPSASSESNGDAVFEFFDDFEETSLDTNKWDVMSSAGTYEITNSQFIAYPGTSGAMGIISKNTYNFEELAIEVRDAVDVDYYDGDYERTVVGVTNDNSYGQVPPNAYHAIWEYKYDDRAAIAKTDANRVETILQTTTGVPVPDSVFVRKTIILHNGYQNFTAHGYFSISASDTSLTNQNSYVFWQGYKSKAMIDWIAVRKYTDPEPTYLIGEEEIREITLELTDGFQLTELYRVGVSKLATESISVSDVLSKQPSITKTESISVSDIFEKLPTKILTETSTLSDVISRGIAKGITETLSVSDITTKSLQRLFEELSTLADYISKLTKKEFVETSQLIDSIQTIRKIVQEITETVSLSDVAYKLASKILQEIETLTDIIKTRITAKSITETLTLQDIIAKSLSRIIAESIALADYVYKKPILTFTETISTMDYVTAKILLIKNLWEYLSLTDYLEIKPAVTPPTLREMINLDKKMALKFITSTARYLEWRKERLT